MQIQMKFMFKYLNSKHSAKIQPGEELRGHITFFLMRGRRGAGTDLFPIVTSYKTRDNGLKLCQRRFRLDI